MSAPLKPAKIADHKKPAPRRKPPAKAQDVARAEVASDVPRVYEGHGLKLTLKAKMPFALLQYMEVEEVEPGALISVLKELLDPPEQIDTIWGAGLDIEQGIALVHEMIESFGVDVGKSAASPDS